MTLCAILLLVGCSPVPSSGFETSDLSLNLDVAIDGGKQETEFIIDVSTSPGRPVNLENGDQLIVYYEDQRTAATRIDDGEYRAIFPFISAGEYRIELFRPRKVSAPDTLVIFNNYPALLSPVSGSSFNEGEKLDLAWQVQSSNGPSLDFPFDVFQISAPICQNLSGDTIVSFDEANPFSRTIVDQIPTTISGTTYNGEIDVLSILNQLERRYELDQRIQRCDVDIDLAIFSGGTAPLSNDPNFEEKLSTLPVILFFDSALAGGEGLATVRSNSARVTLFR